MLEVGGGILHLMKQLGILFLMIGNLSIQLLHSHCECFRTSFCLGKLVIAVCQSAFQSFLSSL